MNNNLYEILRSNRGQLGNFLKDNCEYEYLKKQLIDIENSTEDVKIVEKIFLGKIGQENYKNRAIYELPTSELLTIINFIMNFLGIKHVEELSAGVGLLSYMLSYKLGNEYTVVASDGNRCSQTYNTNKYYTVQSKQFLHYCLDDDFNFDNKLLLISWIPDNDLQDLITLIDKKKPKYIIIIGNGYLNKHLYPIDYQTVIIPVKQLCFKDYYRTNMYYSNDSCKSHMIVMTNDSDMNINNLLLNIKFWRKVPLLSLSPT